MDPHKNIINLSDEDCCYCFLCLILIGAIIGAIVLAFVYWYISLPIVAGVIISIFYYRKHQKEEMAQLLDTIPHQHEYRSITGYSPIQGNQLTDHYKEWLLQKNNISTMDLFKPPRTVHVPSPMQPPQPSVPRSPSSPQITQSSPIEGAQFCALCGSRLKPGSKFCTSCGNKIG